MPDLLYNDMVPQKQLAMKFYCGINYASLFSQNMKFSLFYIFKRALTKSFSSFLSKVWLIERKAAVIIGLRHCKNIQKWPGKALLFCFLRLFWKFFMQVTINFFSFCRTIFGWHFELFALHLLKSRTFEWAFHMMVERARELLHFKFIW